MFLRDARACFVGHLSWHALEEPGLPAAGIRFFTTRPMVPRHPRRASSEPI